jgi:ATP-dependent DNA helicase 2 subunit 2
MDELIDSMDLTKADVDEDGDAREALKPKLTFNPYFQRVYQVCK